jgi:hypothetical protein
MTTPRCSLRQIVTTGINGRLGDSGGLDNVVAWMDYRIMAAQRCPRIGEITGLAPTETRSKPHSRRSRQPSCRLRRPGKCEHDYRELKTGLGIDHFEGRSFTGWHRHVTLTVLAQAFLHPATPGPKSGCAGLTLYAVLRLLQPLLVAVTGTCHTCNRTFDNTT